MTSVDEQQLALAAGVGQNTGLSDQRVAKLQGAVERLNAVAANLRTIAADVVWSGPASLAAQGAFSTLAGAINEHADALDAVAEADAGTSAPLTTAYHDYQAVLSVVETPGTAYYGAGNRTTEQFRADEATLARERLDTAMIAARGRLVSAASWDLDPPLPPDTNGGGVTGTIPDGTGSTPTPPGGVDPIPPVVGTVPPGSQPAPSGNGGFDPTGPVVGTVPYGTGSSPSVDGGGVDPVGPVTGTVPGSGGSFVAPRDLVAELRHRLG